jgi:peroxiredoxin
VCRLVGLRKVASCASGLLLAVAACAWPALAIQVGETAPTFTLYDVQGQTHTLSDGFGSVVLLYFLGGNPLGGDSNVSVSIAKEIEQRFQQNAGDRGLVILGIDCWDDSSDQLELFQDECGVTFPLLANGRATAQQYQVPYNSFVLIDSKGIVRYVSVGPDANAYDPEALESAIRRVMEDANAIRDATWGVIKSLYGRSNLIRRTRTS